MRNGYCGGEGKGREGNRAQKEKEGAVANRVNGSREREGKENSSLFVPAGGGRKGG